MTDHNNAKGKSHLDLINTAVFKMQVKGTVILLLIILTVITVIAACGASSSVSSFYLIII